MREKPPHGFFLLCMLYKKREPRGGIRSSEGELVYIVQVYNCQSHCPRERAVSRRIGVIEGKGVMGYTDDQITQHNDCERVI